MSRDYPFEKYCDELGPTWIVHLSDPATGLRAILVVDNVAAGPSIGGVRMAEDVTTDEVFRLARAMSLKNAAAGLPHGGGKAGILADPHRVEREPLVRAFARRIRDIVQYIPGPDMGTDETAMAWVHDEIGRAVGLPRVLGGIPLDEIGATGYGLAASADVAAEIAELPLKGARVAIEGYGNVGRPAARLLVEKGCVLVAASDSKGTAYFPRGIRPDELEKTKRERGSVVEHPGAEVLPTEALLTLPCEILVPAARPDCLHAENAGEVQAKLILQGANIPATAEAEAILHERGVWIVPDFIANAGGVICAAVEYHGGSEAQALDQIASKIRRNTAEVLRRSQETGAPPREAAVEMAKERVLQAMALRHG